MRLGDKEDNKITLVQWMSLGILVISVTLTIVYFQTRGTSNDLFSAGADIEKDQGRHQKRSLASDCHRGMRYIKGNQVSDSSDGGSDWTKCPENCASPDDFPGYDSASPSSFSRDQDEVGMCGAFSAADYIGHRLAEFGRWPKKPEFDRGISAFDLEIQAFAKENDQPTNNTISNFLGPDAKESGKWDNAINKRPDDFLKIAQSTGVCPENAMPSEFRGNGNSKPIRAIYEALQAHLKELKSRTEAGVGIPGLCKECGLVAPGLSDEQWKQVAEVLDSVKDFGQDNFQVLKKIDDIACDGKRVKVPAFFFMQPISFDAMEDWFAQPNSITTISVHSQPLDPDHIRPGPNEVNKDYDRHSIVVYGAAIKNVGGKNICFYKVKNSWGANACENVWGNKSSPDIQCDKMTGSYLVSSEKLKAMSMGIEQ